MENKYDKLKPISHFTNKEDQNFLNRSEKGRKKHGNKDEGTQAAHTISFELINYINTNK